MSYTALRHAGRPGGPLLVTCHGTGGDETQFHRLGQDLMPGAHVTSPRGDVSEQGALRYFRRSGEGVYDMDDLARATATMAGFIQTEAAEAEAAEVIGLGYSNGANILAATALDHGGLMQRLVLLHPLIPWTLEPSEALRGVCVLITAGERDPICPADQTQALIGGLAAQGAEVTAHWHPGGHELRPSELEAIAAFLD